MGVLIQFGGTPREQWHKKFCPLEANMKRGNQMNVYRILLAAGLLGLTACTATTEDTHFFKGFNIGGIFGNASDAKSRYVFAPKRRNPSADTKIDNIICAEPSPDALSQLASAVAVQAQLSVNTGQTDVGASGAFEKSFSEAVQNIGKRTAAIQLLRDGLYRACEAYTNDGIDDFGYTLVLTNIDNVMLKLVALESLAASASPKTDEDKQALAASATTKLKLSQAEGDLAAAIKNSQDAKSNVRRAQARVGNANVLVAGLARRKTGQQTALTKDNTALQTEKGRDLSSADDATKAASAAKITSLENAISIKEADMVETDAEIAAANTAKTAEEAALATANAENAERTTQLTAAQGARDTARTANATAITAAAGIKRELSVGSAGAIVKIATESSGLGSIAAACLAWTAKHNGQGNAKMAKYCDKIIAQVELNVKAGREIAKAKVTN
jgi:hypothetical protein